MASRLELQATLGIGRFVFDRLREHGLVPAGVRPAGTAGGRSTRLYCVKQARRALNEYRARSQQWARGSE